MSVEEIDVSESDKKRSSLSNSSVTEVLKCLSIVLVVRGGSRFSPGSVAQFLFVAVSHWGLVQSVAVVVVPGGIWL